jgi:hypothetical protein
MGAVSSVVDAVSDIGQGVIDTVSDVGSAVDDFVNEEIPGGWATAAIIAAPYLAPELAATDLAAADALGTGSAGSMAAADAVYAGATTPAWEASLANAVPASAAVATPVAESLITSTPLEALPSGLEALPAAQPGALGSGTFATPGDISTELFTQPAGIESVAPAAEPFIQTEGGLYTLPEEVASTQMGSMAETGLTAPTGIEGLPTAAPVVETPSPYVQTEGGLYTLPEEVASTTAGTVAQTGLATPSAGIFQSIADATGLPLGLVSGLGTALGISALGSALSPDQPQQPQGVPQIPVGVGLSPDYKPYEYKPYAGGGIAGLAPMASGGISHLGDYSDGGWLLKGPGDGVSDSIPATIGGKQPARLADGEFVVPARIVSELGNGSTDAGARKLYEMMDKIQSARRKTVGKKQFAKDTKADKFLPT